MRNCMAASNHVITYAVSLAGQIVALSIPASSVCNINYVQQQSQVAHSMVCGNPCCYVAATGLV